AVRRAGAEVEPFADQGARLATADLFVTHNGLRSTHEAVHARVPMLSVPFFWDQPDLARRSAELGLAVPLTEGAVEQPPDAAAVAVAVEAVLDRWESHQDALEEAWEHEARVLHQRVAVLG